MSVFPGFIDASYLSLSKYAAVERSVNFFVESTEASGETKAAKVLYPTPCTSTFSPTPDVPFQGKSRGLIQINGRLFGVNGTAFFEYSTPSAAFPNGDWVIKGNVLDDGLPVFMIANGVVSPGNQQLFISSGDRGYIYQLGTDAFTALSAGANAFQGGRGVAFLDNYFCSIIPGTNGFQVSSQNDGINWGADLTVNIAYTQGQSDELVALIANQEYLYLFGSRRSEIWYNQGGQFFPFAIQPGAFIEMGVGTAGSVVQANGSIFFIGQDLRGGRSIWRVNGLAPVRVSTYAVELALSKYASIVDCVTYAFTWRGHEFVRFIFPSAQAGWTYDCTESRGQRANIWHENSLTDANGNYLAPIERSHAYFNETHVVGSGGAEGAPGTLYYFTDDTLIDIDPVMLLRYSDDGGVTFSSEIEIEVSVGKVGEYDKRSFADCLGSGRDRVFWIRCIDYGDANKTLPITRDRICPHLFNENKTVFYHRLEVETQKGIGREDGASPLFWALVNAYLEFEAGVN